jgi:hypothetical protein
MKTKNENYEPYGEEWKDELMKLPKIMVINMYRNMCLERDELEKAYKDACDAAGSNEQRVREAEQELRELSKAYEGHDF